MKTTPKKNGGFTLVELIVVIAILAILAAVAIPAYSGYIAKAEKAGDLQLLGAVNEAFAAACVANGTDVYMIDNANLTMPKDSNGKMSVTGVASVSGIADATGYDDAFKMFFAGNETSKFKVITSLVFDSTLKVFVDPASSSEVSISYAGSTITVSGETLQALKDSSFDIAGTDALLDQINSATGFAAGFVDDKLATLFASDDFLACAKSALGATTDAEYEEKVGTIIGKLMGEPYNMSKEDAQKQVMANAAVLYASQTAVGYTEDQIKSLFEGATTEIIKSNLQTEGKTAEGMAQATIVYGMYTAYAHQSGDATKIEYANDPVMVLNQLNNDPAFKEYVLNNKNAASDMAALTGSLGVIVDATTSTPGNDKYSAVEDLMVNGYNNNDLKALLAGLTG